MNPISKMYLKTHISGTLIVNRSIRMWGGTSFVFNESNPAKLINGKEIAIGIKNEIKAEVIKRAAHGFKRPALTVIQVDTNPASEIYIRNKLTAADYCGIKTDLIRFPGDVQEADLKTTIGELNDDTMVDGILVQLPLPPHIDPITICNTICFEKDVDGHHFGVCTPRHNPFTSPMNRIVPCTPAAIVQLLKRSNIQTFGKFAVICGRSLNVGLPTSILLQADGKKYEWGMDATVAMCNRFTPRSILNNLTESADIIISATGIPKLITAEHVKPGACVIDVGITRIIQGGKEKIVGDVDFEEVRHVAGHITPVPGGVGPMTVAMLMHNVLYASKIRL